MNSQNIAKYLTHQKADNKLDLIFNHKIKSILNTNKDQYRNKDKHKMIMLK